MSRIFGKTCQNGYVVRDIEGALAHWSERLSVGPFFSSERVRMDWFRDHGADAPRSGRERLERLVLRSRSNGLRLRTSTESRAGA